MGMGQFPICKLKWDFLRTSVTACAIDKNTFSAPFGNFYVRTEIWREIFQKKYYTTPQWGAFHLQTTISKWELPQWGLQRTLGYVCQLLQHFLTFHMTSTNARVAVSAPNLTSKMSKNTHDNHSLQFFCNKITYISTYFWIQNP